MIPTLFFYELGLVALVWLFLMLYWLWPNAPATRYPTRPQLRVPRKRSNAPKLFVGLTHRPHCALWEQDLMVPQGLPPAPPDPLPLRHRRPRTVDTSRHFCPYDGCDYRGWLGLGNLRANGHPSGGPWRRIGKSVRPGNAGRRGVKMRELHETSFIVQRVQNPPGQG